MELRPMTVWRGGHCLADTRVHVRTLWSWDSAFWAGSSSQLAGQRVWGTWAGAHCGWFWEFWENCWLVLTAVTAAGSVAGVTGARQEANTCLPLLTFQSPSSISPLANPKREPAVKEMSFLETATPASQNRVKKAGLEAERWLNHHSFRASYAGI